MNTDYMQGTETLSADKLLELATTAADKQIRELMAENEQARVNFVLEKEGPSDELVEATALEKLREYFIGFHASLLAKRYVVIPN